jgi:hypothetical protein
LRVLAAPVRSFFPLDCLFIAQNFPAIFHR